MLIILFLLALLLRVLVSGSLGWRSLHWHLMVGWILYKSLQFSESQPTLLSLASLVVSSSTADQRLSSCKASDRVLVSTRNVTAAGHEFQVSTKACSADVLNSRALQKRQVFDLCNNGETVNFECVVGEGAGPLFNDCANLEEAIIAAFEQPGDNTLFSVEPQFAQEFSLGSCLWAWINDNPVGGAILDFCFSEVTNIGAILNDDCIIDGVTAGIAFPSGVNFVEAADERGNFASLKMLQTRDIPDE
ncbi:hypothetical protein B0H11DRAFT_2236331 [Mycena galericulata]|nr:hypothetical protein B0H11DRAFT_2236331 [Mycena galericulata]